MSPQLPTGQGPILPGGPFAPAPVPTDPPLPFTASPPPIGWMPPGYAPPGYAPPGYAPAGYAPPGYPPAPPPRRKRRWVRTTFFFLLLAFSLLLNLIHFAGSEGVSPERGVVAVQVIAGDSDQQVAVVPLEGEIDSATAERFDRFLTRIEDNANVKTLVVEIDTPGGTVTAADEIYKRIRRYKDARKEKGRSEAVVVSMKSMATSGGYYAACAGDRLFAEPTTLTGNIGVLMPSLNFSGLLKRYGVEETTVVSTGAVYKNSGSPYAPEGEKDRKYLQSLADNAFRRFKDVVTEGRGSRLVGNIDDWANGKVYVAGEAKDAGLIDDIGYPRDAYDYAAKTAGLKKPNVVRYQEPPPGLGSLLFSRSGLTPLFARGAGGSAGGAGNVTVNGVNVNVGPESLDRFATPRLLYRWRGD